MAAIDTSSPPQAARHAGLRYVSDAAPGIRRRRQGDSFAYAGPDGRPVRDAETLARIRSLAIPPAWTDVWICPAADGHLQATGRDARGRKQYRYHPRWRAVRDAGKYERLAAFAAALPRIRWRVDRDLARPGLPRDKVLATVVKLLEVSLIRVGNEEYAQQNHSYGLTTLRDRHVRIRGSEIRFVFRGKSGREHRVSVRSQRLARVLRRCEELPGQQLFRYVGDDGNLYPVDSQDVNEYVRQASGGDFTAKDFRTWAGTVLAARALREMERFDSQARAKRNVVAAVERVAQVLGNTRAVCRRCYVHPAVVDSYLDGTMPEGFRERAEDAMRTNPLDLSPEEAAVLALLRLRRRARARRSGAAPST